MLASTAPAHFEFLPKDQGARYQNCDLRDIYQRGVGVGVQVWCFKLLPFVYCSYEMVLVSLIQLKIH